MREEKLQRLFERHIEASHMHSLWLCLLQHATPLASAIIAIADDHSRINFIKRILLPQATCAFIDFMKGRCIELAIKSPQKTIVLSLSGNGTNTDALASAVSSWLTLFVTETWNLVAADASNRQHADSDDLLLVFGAAELVEPQLFCSPEDVRNAAELKDFMWRFVRRGKGFSPEHISQALGMPISDVKRRDVFTPREMALMLELSEQSVINLMSGLSTPVELTAVARRGRHVVKIMRGFGGPEQTSNDHLLSAASTGESPRFPLDVEKVAKKYDLIIAKLEDQGGK